MGTLSPDPATLPALCCGRCQHELARRLPTALILPCATRLVNRATVVCSKCGYRTGWRPDKDADRVRRMKEKR